MAEKKNFSRYNIRCGLVLKAKEGGVRLKRFQLPAKRDNILILTASDLVENEISFFGGSMPLLAKDEIRYKGQPLLCVFAPDFERAELIMRQIIVETEPISKPKRSDSDEDHIPPLFFSYGQDAELSEEELKSLKKTESTFTFSPTTYISALRYTVSAWKEGDQIFIECPTKWPELVRSTVANVAGIEEKRITLKPTNLYSRHDEYLIMPAIYAAFAVIGTLQLTLPVEIRAVGESARAGMKFVRTTLSNSDGRPISESVDVEVDQGAYLFAAEEMQRQIMTGLIPPYQLKRFVANVKTITSNNHPASFCGSLGYSEAHAALEYHHSKLADKGLTPAILLDSERGKTRFTDYVPALELEPIREQAKGIINASNFNRKWATNNFQKGKLSLVGYLKGIGIAAGAGVAGLSTTLARDNKFSATMTYTQKKNVTINTSATTSDNITKYWKELIRSRIDNVEGSTNVIFSDAASSMDTGPDVLSRFVSCFTPQLAAAAKKINTLRIEGKPPVSVKFNAKNIAYPCEFEHSGFGTIITEIKISDISFKPAVVEIWASFSFNHIIDPQDVRNKARRSILTTLDECGAAIPSSFKLNLEINSRDGGSETISNIESIARSLTMASLASAISQALSERDAIFPLNTARIEKKIKRGKK